VTYDERLDPLADLPTPQDCIRRIEIVLAERKITFAPGSAEIEGESAEVVDEIAEVLRACREVEMQVEIAGHTDSQGRETMNRDLSESRAMAVLEALADRRVPISRITAKGYGETQPIADNDSEAGREANRRIEFRLLAPTQAAGEAQGETETPGAAPPDGSAGAGAEPEEGDGAE
jgi:OOP family OmpA-OmpF porin